MNDRYHQGETFTDFLPSVTAHEALWNQLYERAKLPPEIADSAASVLGIWHLLVLAEDWCADAVHVVPFLARLTEQFSNFHLRVLSRDEHPDLMDSHLTNGTRSIPVVMILDEDFHEVAWWGPRPLPLQEIFHAEIKHLPQEERFPKVRAWYARDRGNTSLKEILSRIPAVV